MAWKNTSNTALARRNEGGLATYSPWNAVEQMHREMDDLFSRAFGYTPLSRLIGETHSIEPAVDIFETNDNLQFYASLPGFVPDDVNVEATADMITIQGERKPVFTEEKANVHRQGWASCGGSVSVSYKLPVEVNPNEVKATFKNGILEIVLPKAEHVKPRGVKVEVAGS